MERYWNPETDEADLGFVIDNDQKALWAMRKITAAKAEAKRWADYYKEQADKAKREAEGTEAYFAGHLAEYFRTLPHKVTKTQESYQLPDGMKLYTTNAKQDIAHDDAVLLEWAKNNAPELVKVSYSLRWDELKKRLITQDGTFIDKETGEIIENGLSLVDVPEQFKMTFGKEG